MKNIAISTEKFIDWNGGLDFIKRVISVLAEAAKKQEVKIFIFVQSEKKYKRHKGLKRAYYKFMSKFLDKITLEKTCAGFEEFSGLIFVKYLPKQLPKALKKFKIDIMLPHITPDYFKLETKTIGYLHDCQHKYYPEFFSKEEIEVRNTFFENMINSDGKIIVNANSVKNDLIKFFNATPENLSVLPFLPTLKPEYLNDSTQSIKKYNLSERYFLLSNQFWAHKDHATAFKAFAKLVKSPQYNDLELICTGLMEDYRNPQHIEDLKTLIENLGCTEKIRILGLVPKSEQIEIMKSSLALIQPTLFEGGRGGGSVWDAISLGVSSVVSDIEPNLEIKEENMLFFKTKDENDLALKMEEIINSPKQKVTREQLIEKSQKNAKKLNDFLLDLINKSL